MIAFAGAEGNFTRGCFSGKALIPLLINAKLFLVLLLLRDGFMTRAIKSRTLRRAIKSKAKEKEKIQHFMQIGQEKSVKLFAICNFRALIQVNVDSEKVVSSFVAEIV